MSVKASIVILAAFLACLNLGCGREQTPAERRFGTLHKTWKAKVLEASRRMPNGNILAYTSYKEFRQMVQLGPEVIPQMEGKLRKSLEAGKSSDWPDALFAYAIVAILGWNDRDLMQGTSGSMDLFAKNVLTRLDEWKKTAGPNVRRSR